MRYTKNVFLPMTTTEMSPGTSRATPTRWHVSPTMKTRHPPLRQPPRLKKTFASNHHPHRTAMICSPMMASHHGFHLNPAPTPKLPQNNRTPPRADCPSQTTRTLALRPHPHHATHTHHHGPSNYILSHHSTPPLFTLVQLIETIQYSYRIALTKPVIRTSSPVVGNSSHPLRGTFSGVCMNSAIWLPHVFCALHWIGV